MAYCCIYQLVYSRHGEGVFWTSFIQVCEIYTHLPLPIFLLHHHSVGQPLRVKHLLNGPSLFKLCHLILDIIKMLLG